MKLDERDLRALGFRPCPFDPHKWDLVFRDVVEQPDRASDDLGRGMIVWAEDGACCLTEYDRDGEIEDMVSLPPAPDFEWLRLLVLRLKAGYAHTTDKED